METIGWISRFWSKVKVGHPWECWLWTGATNLDGYGRAGAWVAPGIKKTKQAHHVALFLSAGKWPKYVLHKCDTPACCNPSHLREGTHQENIAECWKKGRGRVGKNFAKLPKILQMIDAGARNKDIVAALGVKNDAVSRIRHGILYRRPRSRQES